MEQRVDDEGATRVGEYQPEYPPTLQGLEALLHDLDLTLECIDTQLRNRRYVPDEWESPENYRQWRVRAEIARKFYAIEYMRIDWKLSEQRLAGLVYGTCGYTRDDLDESTSDLTRLIGVTKAALKLPVQLYEEDISTEVVSRRVAQLKHIAFGLNEAVAKHEELCRALRVNGRTVLYQLRAPKALLQSVAKELEYLGTRQSAVVLTKEEAAVLRLHVLRQHSKAREKIPENCANIMQKLALA